MNVIGIGMLGGGAGRMPGFLRGLSVIVACFISISGFAEFDGDQRVWTAYTLTEYQKDALTLYSYGDMRWSDEGHFLGLWLVSQKVKYRYNRHLDLGAGYNYIEGRSDPGNPWNTQHWFEMEAMPRLSLTPDLTLKLRNRFETRWIESLSFNPVYKSRHRLYLHYRTSFLPGMECVEVSNELFYNYTDEMVDENRFFPLSVQFKTSETTGIDLFFMVGSIRTAAARDWESAFVSGITLRWDFDAFVRNHRSRSTN